MALRDLQEFLVALSKHQSLREAFKRNPAEVGAEAGLSQEEISLLSEGSETDIKRYLGDNLSDAIPVKRQP